MKRRGYVQQSLGLYKGTSGGVSSGGIAGKGSGKARARSRAGVFRRAEVERKTCYKCNKERPVGLILDAVRVLCPVCAALYLFGGEVVEVIEERKQLTYINLYGRVSKGKG